MQIKRSLNLTIDGLINIRSNTTNLSLFGPYIGRSIIELGCTAIIARLDPFRVLLLRKVQMQPDYQLAERNKVSIQWQGDILSNKIGNEIWSNKNINNPTRALIGDYYENIFWKTAIDKMIDNIPDDRGGDWFQKVRRTGSDGFCNMIRGELQRLYSSLSKGIHNELLIPTESIYDFYTISDLIREVFYVISTLGLAVNYIPYTPYVLTENKSICFYEKLQTVEII